MPRFRNRNVFSLVLRWAGHKGATNSMLQLQISHEALCFHTSGETADHKCGTNSMIQLQVSHQGLHLCIQSLALCTLATKGAETIDTKYLARLLDGLCPLVGLP